MKKALSLMMAIAMIATIALATTAPARAVPKPDSIPVSPDYRVCVSEVEDPAPGHRDFIVEVLWNTGTKVPTVMVATYDPDGRMARIYSIPIESTATWAMCTTTVTAGQTFKVLVIDKDTYLPLVPTETYPTT